MHIAQDKMRLGMAEVRGVHGLFARVNVVGEGDAPALPLQPQAHQPDAGEELGDGTLWQS